METFDIVSRLILAASNLLSVLAGRKSEKIRQKPRKKKAPDTRDV